MPRIPETKPESGRTSTDPLGALVDLGICSKVCQDTCWSPAGLSGRAQVSCLVLEPWKTVVCKWQLELRCRWSRYIPLKPSITVHNPQTKLRFFGDILPSLYSGYRMICMAIRTTLANASCASKQNSRRKQLNESSWWWFRRQIKRHHVMSPSMISMLVWCYVVLISLPGTWSAIDVFFSSRPEPKKSDAWSGDQAGADLPQPSEHQWFAAATIWLLSKFSNRIMVVCSPFVISSICIIYIYSTYILANIGQYWPLSPLLTTMNKYDQP